MPEARVTSSIPALPVYLQWYVAVNIVDQIGSGADPVDAARSMCGKYVAAHVGEILRDLGMELRAIENLEAKQAWKAELARMFTTRMFSELISTNDELISASDSGMPKPEGAVPGKAAITHDQKMIVVQVLSDGGTLRDASKASGVCVSSAARIRDEYGVHRREKVMSGFSRSCNRTLTVS